jgi:hypothetical protein
LTASWHSAKVVRTRDKISFFGGVMSLLISALLFGMAPQCVNLHSLIRGRLIYCAQVGSYLIYAPSIISTPVAGLQIQETLLALLLVRPLLLCDRTQLHLHLVPASKSYTVRSVLLSLTWVTRQRGHHMAEQPCIS